MSYIIPGIGLNYFKTEDLLLNLERIVQFNTSLPSSPLHCKLDLFSCPAENGVRLRIFNAYIKLP